MDECIVARNATLIIKRALCRAKKVPHLGFDAQDSCNVQQQAGIVTDIWNVTNADPSGDTNIMSSLVTIEGAVNNNVDDGDLNWLNAIPFDDGQQAMFWTEWAHELDVLGT
jgi:hypothetical protein